MNADSFTFVVLLCGGMGILVFLIASERRLANPGAWLIYALLIWPVALIHVIMATPPEPKPAAGEMRKCPECAEMIRAEARKCRYCQSVVAPIEKAPPKPLSRREERMRGMEY